MLFPAFGDPGRTVEASEIGLKRLRRRPLAHVSLQELGVSPFERGLEPVLGPDGFELPADLGGGRVERGDHVETCLQGIVEACSFDPAIDGELGGGQRLGRDQGEALGIFQRRAAQLGERHDPVDHAERERRRCVDQLPEIQKLTRALVADDPRHDDPGPGLREQDFGLPELRVVGRDREVAKHRQLASPAERVPLHRGDHRLAQVPGRHQGAQAERQPPMIFERIVAPGRIGAIMAVAADVEADAEGAAFGTQHDDAGRGIVVGHAQRPLELETQLHAQGIELVGPIQSDDADLLVDLIEYALLRHPDSSQLTRHPEPGHQVARCFW
jgi:hypothetical protein